MILYWHEMYFCSHFRFLTSHIMQCVIGLYEYCQQFTTNSPLWLYNKIFLGKITSVISILFSVDFLIFNTHPLSWNFCLLTYDDISDLYDAAYGMRKRGKP